MARRAATVVVVAVASAVPHAHAAPLALSGTAPFGADAPSLPPQCNVTYLQQRSLNALRI
jgi:hypothetical protein